MACVWAMNGMSLIERTMADAIKADPADDDWVVWITPSDAAARALRGLEAAGYVVRPADDRGAVDLLRESLGGPEGGRPADAAWRADWVERVRAFLTTSGGQ